MSAHTPGPWVANGNGIHKGARCVAVAYMEPKEQRDIDARLIAAAPDLLAILQKWICDSSLQTFEDRERFRNEARAALAKVDP